MMTKAHLDYEGRRHVLFLKFIREKRGLSPSDVDKLCGYYSGWTRRMERGTGGNYMHFKLFRLHLLYKITVDEPGEFLRKHPRNKKYKLVTY